MRRDATDAVVTVGDTGIGVPAAEISRLFERFHRIETPYARSSEGSGIGLALVKELVGLHEGSITVDSIEGAGTTFTIRLPLGVAHLPADAVSPMDRSRDGSGIAEPYVQEALRWVATLSDAASSEGTDVGLAPVSAASQVWGAGPPPRVLIADDNIDMREYLARLLGAAGYGVDFVSDGIAALESVRADAPDLLISDVMMPRLDGVTLVKELRADARTAAVPVVLLSARAGQEASIEGLRAGADDYLVKPFVAAELLARVRANIELARLRNHQARWRSALIESIQEAFFVCDEHGAVIEVNAAFAHILGYGPDGLPYRPMHPWWPDPETDPDSHLICTDVVQGAPGRDERHLCRSRGPPRRPSPLDQNRNQPCPRPRHRPASRRRNLPRCDCRTLRCAAPERVGRTQRATGASGYGRRRASCRGSGIAPTVAGTLRSGHHIPAPCRRPELRLG